MINDSNSYEFNEEELAILANLSNEECNEEELAMFEKELELELAMLEQEQNENSLDGWVLGDDYDTLGNEEDIEQSIQIQKQLVQADQEKFAQAYNVLGLREDATLKEIKQAFNKLALKFHPDKTGGNGDLFKLTREAYEILTNRSSATHESEIKAICDNHEKEEIVASNYTFLLEAICGKHASTVEVLGGIILVVAGLAALTVGALVVGGVIAALAGGVGTGLMVGGDVGILIGSTLMANVGFKTGALGFFAPAAAKNDDETSPGLSGSMLL